MAFSRWPSFDEVFFAPAFVPRVARAAGVYPAVNIHDDGQAYLLRAEIPGLDKDAIEVSVKGDEVTLRGERKIDAPGPKASFHRRERDSGQFRRVVTLPEAVDSERISASYRDGVLEVTLPRSPKAQPRKVAIH